MEISSIDVIVEGYGDTGQMAACELRIIAPVVAMEAQAIQQKSKQSEVKFWETLENGPKLHNIPAYDQHSRKLEAKQVRIELEKRPPQKIEETPGLYRQCDKLPIVENERTFKEYNKLPFCETNHKETNFSNPVTVVDVVVPVKDEFMFLPDHATQTLPMPGHRSINPESGDPFLDDPEQSHTWHGRTKVSGDRRSRSSSRGSSRRSSHHKHRGSLDSKASLFQSDGLKVESGQGTSSLHNLQSGDSASLLDIMHKKFCSQQYDLEKRAKSVETLHRTHGVPFFGLVHSHSDCQVYKPLPNIPSLEAFERSYSGNLTSPRLTNKQKSKSKKISRCPVSLPKGHNHKSKKKDQAELEAVEACSWLRAAGFPQYAQLYEDGLFPIELTSVEVDHDFLDPDSIQSLYRRLNTLNKCAYLKVEAPTRKSTDDSDDEDQCALSDKWKYLRTSRRWSRKDLDVGTCLVNSSTLRSASSHDSLLTDPESVNMVDENKTGSDKEGQVPKNMQTLAPDASQKMKRSTSGSFIVSPRLRRAASERIKSARNLLKRVESFKRSRSRKPVPDISYISQPVIVDSKDMQAKIQHLNCKEIKPHAEEKTMPEPQTKPPDFVTASSEDMSDNSRTAPEIPDWLSRERLSEKLDKNAIVQPPPEAFTPLSHSEMDSSTQAIATAARAAVENRLSRRSHRASHLTNSPETPHRTGSLTHTDILRQTYLLPQDYIPGSFPKELSKGREEAEPVTRVRLRTVSGACPVEPSQSPPVPNHRASVYDNVPTQNELAAAHKELDIILKELFQDIDGLSQVLNSTENDAGVEDKAGSLSLRLNLDDSLTKSDLPKKVVRLDDTLNSLWEPLSDKDINDSPDSKFSTVSSHGELSSPSSPNEFVSRLSPMEVDSDRSPIELKDMEPSFEVDSVLSPHNDVDISFPADADSMTSPADIGTISSLGEGGTASSHDASDPEGSRERRDSGVGSSLTRAPSDRRRTRIRWHSFQKSHRPSFNSRNLQIESFSAGQLMVLRKLSLLKLTAIMEKFSPVNRTGWNWVVNRLLKRVKTPDYRDKNMFGVPLLVTLQRTGQPIPQCMLYAMRFLRKTSKDAVGIFRKSGVRSRIQKLRNDLEQKPDLVDSLDELQAYDVADLLKQYFRELPECLLTTKLSETFISIFTYVPPDLRLEALQSAVILMPDENREVLQSLLLFLSDIALSSKEHQMTASNLAVCFAPSLFSICGPRSVPPTASPRTKRSNNKGLGVPDQRELLDQKAAHECLTMMIVQCKQLFMISGDTLAQCRFSYMEEGEPVSLEELCKTDQLSSPDITAYVDSCIKGILKESREKFKNWMTLSAIDGVELSYKKVGDGHPLRLWKCSVEVEAPPTEVLNRILAERYMWDEDLLQWRVVEKITNQADVFQFVRNSMAPHPTRDYCVLRSWRTDLAKGACVLVSTSIDHPGAPILGGVRGVVLASRFLIEPCGSGKSRVTHLSRIDIRGKGPDWYVKVYGHICSNFMSKIKTSFKHGEHISEGPETKV